MRIAEWVAGVAVLVIGAVLAGIAMFGMGVALLWSGYDPAGEASRPWWLWLLFLAPPVLMVLAGILVRRAGASVPIALGGAGATGVLLGVAYLVTSYLTGR